MEANRSRTRWTYAEFARLPSEGNTRYEVIDGELAVTPAPTGAHQVVVSNLMWILGKFVREHALGIVLPSPVDVLFGEGDYLEPDVVFVRTERRHLIGDRGIEGAPDLVIEILSPSTAQRDRGIKLERDSLDTRERWADPRGLGRRDRGRDLRSQATRSRTRTIDLGPFASYMSISAISSAAVSTSPPPRSSIPETASRWR